jgi:hemoglobin-like flavoprotein
MNPQQIQAVQQSFRLLEPVAEPAMLKFYDRLFEVDPELRHLFRASRDEQAKKLAQTLTVVVKSLDRPEQILGAVKDLGRRHGGYGVKDSHYETVGAALLWTLEQGLGEAFTPEVRDGWATAYALLASVMQDAATGNAAHAEA